MSPARRTAPIFRLLFLLVLVGCGRGSPAPPAGTGAREKTQEFYEALIARAWPRAENQLDAKTANFAARAEKYLQKLGFVPGKVYVRFCEENGDQAVAHVLLTTAADSRKDSFRASLVLKKSPAGWSVVLSPNFGN